MTPTERRVGGEDNATWKVRFSHEHTAHVTWEKMSPAPAAVTRSAAMREKARAVKLESTLCNSVKHHLTPYLSR